MYLQIFKMKYCVVFVLFIYSIQFSHQQFSPLRDPFVCGKPTCQHASKFNYSLETNYQYEYTTEINTMFLGSSKNKSSVYINVHASVEYLTECEAVLVLSNSRLSDKPDQYDHENDEDLETPLHPKSENFAEALSQNQLRFSFEDGKINEICPDEGEPNWVLNFKRGLLSMFQNSMRRFDMDHYAVETDVNGVCAVQYTLKGAEGATLVITKTRDIESCDYRYKHHSVLQTTPYSFRSNKNDIPIMSSTSECQLSIDHKIYSSIVCTEKHLFKPFSNRDAGATTITKQKLTLVSESPISPEEKTAIRKRKTLLYDHVPTPKQTSNELKHARELVKKMCVFSKEDSQMEFSHAFSKFIQVAGSLSYATISTVYHRANSFCETGKKHVADALPFLGSDAAVILMKDIIEKKEIPDEIAKEWVLSFAFIPRPSTTMLSALKSLLEIPNTDATYSLSVASVIKSFCRWTPDCNNVLEVQRIITHIEKEAIKAHLSKFNNRITHEKLLVSLKSLGNIGIVSEPFKKTMQEIIEDEEIDIEIRIAAVEAYRRMPCEETRSYFTGIYRKYNADTQLRIASYLQAMRCPDYGFIQVIKNTLAEEEVNQVGSFVWTHLNNLLKSSVPTRIEIQGLLSDNDLGRKFSNDVRKFSNNYEGSIFFEKYNAGASYESNVIFSPESYFPRSASLNFTVDLFGESINFFEINGRVEGIESYLEDAFGPNRTFNAKNVKDKLSNIRIFREANENSILKSAIEEIPNVLKKNFKSPKASLGLKVFGNEVLYSTFVGDKEIKDAVNTVNPITYLKKILSGKEISYEKAAVFLDTSYIVPTGAGLPIILNAAGTAAVNLKMSGALLASGFLVTGEFDLSGYLKPSIAVDIVGSMLVDVYYTSTGVKLKTNLHSSTAIEGHVKLSGPRVASVHFKLPKNKTDVFGVESEIIVVQNDHDEYQIDITDDPVSDTQCSWPFLDETVGLKLCSYYKFPNLTTVKNLSSNVLFHGPSKFKIYLEKADPTADLYIVEYRWITTPQIETVGLVFDTPGSAYSRMMSANLTVDIGNQNVTLLLKSRKGNYLINGKYKNTNDEKSADLILDANGKKHFNGHIGYKRRTLKYGHIYYPKFYLAVNGQRTAELSGNFTWITKRNVSQSDLYITFNTKKFSTILQGAILVPQSSIQSNLKLTYKFENATQEFIHVIGGINYRSNIYKLINGTFELVSTAYPKYNFVTQFKYIKGSGRLEALVNYNNGPHLADKNHTLTLQFVFSATKAPDGSRLNTYLLITKPAKDLNMKFQIQHTSTGPTSHSRMLIRYAKNKDIDITLFLMIPHKTFMYFEGKLNVSIPTFHPMVLQVKVEERALRLYAIDVFASWFSGHNLTIEGKYNDYSTMKASDHLLKLNINSPSFENVYADCRYYQNDTQLMVTVVAKHLEDEYSIQFKHSAETEEITITEAEIKYKNKRYYGKNIIDFKDKKQISLELHIDRLRDIFFSLKSINQPAHKFIGGEFRWDSNRDPTQKIVLSLEYFQHGIYNTSGNFIFTYPERTVYAHYDFAIKESKLQSEARLIWSPTDVIDLTINADYKHGSNNKLLIIKTELLTPFKDWYKTSINGGFEKRNNMLRLNGSVFWRQDAYIAGNLYTNFKFEDAIVECELNSSIISTIAEVPSVTFNVKHNHGAFYTDDDIYIMYNEKQIISLRSSWNLDKHETSKDLTGSMILITPIQGYKKGILITKLSYSDDKKIKGFSELDFDSRKFTATCKGHFKRLLDSKFDFNVTTPFEKHKTIVGRFGLSEENKHVVSEIRTTSSAIGFEVKFQVNNIIDFDILLSAASPFEFLKVIQLFAKLKKEAVDFRIGWNYLLVGFVGVWRYHHIKDFEYAYKLYTPIEGIEENGVVARFIFEDGIDLEGSVSLGTSRFGVVVMGKPKPRLMEELGLVKVRPILFELDIENDGEESWNSWEIIVELDLAMYPSIRANIDYDQIDTFYVIVASVVLPDGVVNIRDEFYLEDYYTMKNGLAVTTPYITVKELTSNWNLEIVYASMYHTAFDIKFKNDTKWVETAFKVNYTYEVGEEEDVELDIVHIYIRTPFSKLPRIDFNGLLEVEENQNKLNVSLQTNTTSIEASSNFEYEEGFLDGQIYFKADSPYLTVKPMFVNFKKDFSEVSNGLEFSYNVVDFENETYKFEIEWGLVSAESKKVKIKVLTPIPDIRWAEISMIHGRTENNSTDTALRLVYNEYMIDLNSTIAQNRILVEMVTFIEPYRKITIDLTQNYNEKDANMHFQGMLKTEAGSFPISGYYVVQDGSLVKIKLNPNTNGIEFLYTGEYQYGIYTYHMKLRDVRQLAFVIINGNYQYQHKLDWKFVFGMTTSHPKLNKLQIELETKTPSNNVIDFELKTTSSLKSMEKAMVKSNIVLLPDKAGTGKLNYELVNQKGNLEAKWKWIMFENMYLNFISHRESNENVNHMESKFFYINPGSNLSDFTAGVRLTVDKNNWAIGTNTSLKYTSPNEIEGSLNLELPKPNIDIHTGLFKYHLTKGTPNALSGKASYTTVNSKVKYAVEGLVDFIDNANIGGNVKFIWDPDKYKFIDNKIQLSRKNDNIMLKYKLQSPKFLTEDTFATDITYNSDEMDYHNIMTKLYYPESKRVFDAKINFQSLNNMNGTINMTAPFIAHIGGDFVTITETASTKRYLHVFWPNNTALLDSTYVFNSHHNDRSGNGKILLEIPLTSRHTTVVNYGYNEKKLHKTGFAKVQYNDNKLLDGTYNCDSEQRAGFEKDITTVEIQNNFTPLGILYIHQIETDAAEQGFIPTVDSKRFEMYKLKNRTSFNITGEIKVKSTFTGQQIKLSAHHINKSITLDTEYEVLDQKFFNKAKLQLAKDIWLAYNLDLHNMTVDENSEMQHLELKISHPIREVTILGSYNISDSALASDLSLRWHNQSKIKNIEAAFNWEQFSSFPNHQQVIFELRHPTFEKNVTFVGEYYKDRNKLSDVKLSVEYSNDIDRRVELAGTLQDYSTPDKKNYTFEMHGKHPATSFELALKSELNFHSRYYHTHHHGKYNSRLSSLEHGDINATLDINRNEVQIMKKSRTDETYFRSKYNGVYPIYGINMSAIYGTDINATGVYYLNIDEKLIKLEVNVTPDAIQTINMYGTIPDTRSAYFDFWRVYDDIKMWDISYYLKLNHSSLVTSKLLWRPELSADIKEGLVEIASTIYNTTNDNVEYWKKMVPSKTEEALVGIWGDAEPFVEGFLNDARDLNVLEQDIDKFKIFLNETYNNNEFYIQNITFILKFIIEELSVKEHVESVPGKINELWEVMGESGKTMRKSLEKLIATLQDGYKKTMEVFNNLIKGEGMNQLSTLMKSFIEKYDKFIKDLHISFIKHAEKLWSDTHIMLTIQWNKMLQAIEPTFLKFVHYLETIIWEASREFLDFLYKRKTEIVDSPYFIEFSSLTHDIDHFYKDMMHNSIITNIRKYSNTVWTFIREKYFKVIPFGKELNDVFTEIIEELKQLQNLPSIQFFIQKYDEVSMKVTWFYDYFEIGDRLQSIFSILHMKLTEITQTALEAENKYRSAKTKFIFDPDSGLMQFEQKLPMSWHSFNDTMKFGEIPEIKMINNLQNYLITSNVSFWQFYYEYKPYTEPTTWLPPFDAYALIAGPQHFVTFDGRHYKFSGECSYLLAHDFKDQNFSVAVTYNVKGKQISHKILLFVKEIGLEIDFATNSVKVSGRGVSSRLPLNVESTYVYQENEIITVDSKLGFMLKCNMKYAICKFKLSGWYFGKTAGLWGTMDNEPGNDMMTSTGRIGTDPGRFAQSWSLKSGICSGVRSPPLVETNTNKTCEAFFQSKVSSLAACFSVVSPTPFYEMCHYSHYCVAVAAYMEACEVEHTPLRIPDACVSCTLTNGTQLEEGDFVVLQDEHVPQSSDIVFIIEAKKCNTDLSINKHMSTLTSLLHKELLNVNLTNNRYAVVIFGGSDVFNEPRSIVFNNDVFTNHQQIPQYFENIPVGNGTSDIFQALSYASKLIFRPGVSKTFIAFPCTECDPDNMKLDYNVMHQLLRENDITLHILMNNEFVLPKTRDIKKFYGIDSNTSYTNKDVKELKGDLNLRKQVKLPKSFLGYCIPLAIETNGSVFSAKKLDLEKKKPGVIKKFLTVFAKRVSASAVPNKCQMCECTAVNSGTSFMECFPCDYPNTVYIDYGFNDDDSFSNYLHSTFEED